MYSLRRNNLRPAFPGQGCRPKQSNKPVVLKSMNKQQKQCKEVTSASVPHVLMATSWCNLVCSNIPLPDEDRLDVPCGGVTDPDVSNEDSPDAGPGPSCPMAESFDSAGSPGWLGPPERALFQRLSNDSLVFSDLSSLVSERSGYFRNAWIKVAAASQTDPPPAGVDAAVNTTIVMDAFSFRCVTCSKPPAKPKPHPKYSEVGRVCPG